MASVSKSFVRLERIDWMQMLNLMDAALYHHDDGGGDDDDYDDDGGGGDDDGDDGNGSNNSDDGAQAPLNYSRSRSWSRAP